MRATNREISSQANFCATLMEHLKEDVFETLEEAQSEYSFPGGSRIQDDVKRLRRELLKLGKMVAWNYRIGGKRNEKN